ncbi:Ig-like domain-containing protein [Glacieibacterium frigidum]|uniref:Endonuclease/exonuclease/phosphatase n=1 Tax=Glacieibacterium frigidum TaxID=2593303 RepID=A0A552UIF0_9SPHN|nr:Ig-like domain-containing protein [Glacieibacterium frigidum]TRW17993.1 endonuclease/exonuclease/phosphatase [Glacieibacterium frigidum]
MTTTAFSLAGGNFSQDWSNIGLITANDVWSGVPSIVGYLGNGITSSTGVDPRTLTAATLGDVDVIANQTNTTINNGGVAEFEIANPVVALQGSGTANAPSLVIYLDATGRENLNFSVNIRDVDGGNADNSIQQVNVQYRLGDSGVWTNLPGGYIADATTGPNASTLITALNIALPGDTANAPLVEIRIMTTNAAGNDEWVGIDDILVTSTPQGADTVAPQLAASNPTTPSDNAVAVDGNVNLTIRFNEAVKAGTGSITISDGGSDIRVIDVTDTTQVSFSGSVLTINPAADLLAGRTYDVTFGSGVVLDTANNAFAGIAQDAFDFTVFDASAILTIGAIQGLGHTSAYAGTRVVTEGVVTAVDTNGFYIQSADGAGDGDVRTSDGIFVFTSSAPTVTAGQLIRVDGNVTEFRPGTAPDNATNLTITEIVAPTVTVLGTGTATAVLIGTGGRTPPTSVIDDDNFSSYDVTTDGIDFYESLEGQLVRIDNPMVVGPTNNFRETFVVVSDGAGATGISERGGITLSAGDNNPERIQLDDDTGLFTGFTGNYTIGDKLSAVTGIVNYGFGSYEVLVTQAVTFREDVSLGREQTTLVGDASHLTLASFNVENLDPTDPQEKFDLLALEITSGLKNPDIIGVQEIQDADGAGNGGNFSGAATAAKLIAAISAAGGPTYSYVEVAPTANNTTGGEPNGNIRNGYLYNDARVDYVEGSATLLNDSAFNGSRKPLIADFTFNGQTVTLVNIHSTSRGGSDPFFGSVQPPAQAGETARNAQGAAVKAFTDGVLAADPGARLAVLGDANGYYFEQSLSQLTADGKLTNLYSLLPVEERYSYLFEGNLQAFDNIIVSNALLGGAQFDVVHENSEQLEAAQPTDHDQPVARLLIAAPNTAPVAVADAVSVAEDASTTNLVSLLLANDGDVDFPAGDSLTIVSVGTSATQGSVQFDQATQSLIYVADAAAFDALNAGQTASDTFTYTVRDEGGLESTATVTVTVNGVDNDPIIGTNGADTINGTAFDDQIFGLGGADTLRGLGGNDYIDGGTGLDIIQGGAGNNILLGGEGNDIFAGEATQGVHTIDGNGGVDLFMINSSGEKVVVDLQAGTVTGGYATGSTLASVEMAQAVSQLASQVEIYGSSMANVAIGGRGNDVLDGRGGNDKLLGGLGADVLTGGAGNDVFVFRIGDAQGETITDFDGRGNAVGDTLSFEGFGPGAFLTNVGTEWTVHYGAKVETFTLVGVTSLAANDVVFG